MASAVNEQSTWSVMSYSYLHSAFVPRQCSFPDIVFVPTTPSPRMFFREIPFSWRTLSSVWVTLHWPLEHGWCRRSVSGFPLSSHLPQTESSSLEETSALSSAIIEMNWVDFKCTRSSNAVADTTQLTCDGLRDLRGIGWACTFVSSCSFPLSICSSIKSSNVCGIRCFTRK